MQNRLTRSVCLFCLECGGVQNKFVNRIFCLLVKLQQKIFKISTRRADISDTLLIPTKKGKK